MILLLGKPTNHYQINLLNLLSVFSWSGPIPTQQEVSSTRVVSWSQRLSPGLKWTANRDAGSGMEAWEKFGPPRNNGPSPYLSCLQLPHSHTTWSERLNKSDVCRILAIMHIKLRIQIHPGHHTAMILSVSSWLCETCPCLPHPYHILTQARAQRAPNCQECQQRQGDQPNELWRFTKYWHNHPRHLPLWIRSRELLLEWWSSIIIYPNECEVGVPQLQQKNWHTHLLKAGSLFQEQPKWWDLSLMPHPSTEAAAESPPMQEKMDGNVLPTKTCSFLSVH